MLGGFLGAGKTTTVLRLAQLLQRQGLRPGVITNDQAAGLVDTALVEQLDLPVREIAGGCFCCRSESLLEALNRLEAERKPDVFIAEPVGSCTDLIATVSKPLTEIYGKAFVMAPYAVLVDPFRAERVLGKDEGRMRKDEAEAEPVAATKSAKAVKKAARKAKVVAEPPQRNAAGEIPPTPEELAEIQAEMWAVIERIGSRRNGLPEEGGVGTGATGAGGGFHDDVNYIYRKQLEEAEIIVINKVDLVSGARLAALRAGLAEAYPQAQIMEVAAREGLALEPLFKKLTTEVSRPRESMEVDYQRYGRGEAMLGWLNATVKVRPKRATEAMKLLAPLALKLQEGLKRRKIEVAHLKIVLRDEAQPERLLKMQLTRSEEAPAFAGGLDGPLKQGELLINLRAEGDPAKLGRMVKEALRRALEKVPHEIAIFDAFRPGQPVPTHRVA